MKLRYLRLARQRPPLQNLALTFPQDALLSAQPLALRFIVGLNGSGKTTLLQTLAQIFTSLDRDAQPPAFPFWLAYDLEIENQPRTVYLSAPYRQPASLVIFKESLPENTAWDELPVSDDPSIWRSFAGGLPSRGEWEQYLPGAVVVYTSGHTAEWEKIFAPQTSSIDQGDAIPPTPEDERPLGWDVARENEQNRQLGEDQSPLTALPPESLATQYPEKSFFIGPSQLTLASLLVMLKHLAEEGQKNDSLQAIYRELRLPWQAPLAISLSVNLDLISGQSEYATRLADLLKLASHIVREPEPGIWRQLVFELPGRVPKKKYNASIDETDTTVHALLKVLGSETAEIFDAFKTLSGWQQKNLVRDLRLVIKKDEVKDALLLDWLSDGERMLLGRISLFYLLRDKHNVTRRNALLILDEPETHFNDKWKRRLVNMLDDALRDSAYQIVISTHSSILLTDVFNTEIAILEDGEAFEPSGTFGTLPSEIMRNVFDTKNPVGDRAKEFLDAVLTLVEYSGLANRLWLALDETPNPVVDAWIGKEHPFGSIIEIFTQRKKEEKLAYRTPEQWLRLFQGLHRRAKANGPVTLASVLEMLFDYIGPGYYQFELRRQHRRLTEAGENATPS